MVHEESGLDRRRWAVLAAAILLSGVLAAGASWAQGDPNECDEPGDAPDVLVGDLQSHHRWGALGGVTAFSVGTYSCNVGTCWLNWFSSTPNHPAIGQNMYRLKDGRFEQIGQSWLKHGFFALGNELCSTGCIDPPGGSHLGVNCADPYSSTLNGTQDGLGPKFEVNATTGVFPFPATDISNQGDTIYKRLQVHNTDLEPDLNPGALYYVEGHYIAADDAAAANDDNNASYRKVTIDEFSSGMYDIDFDGNTVQGDPAILAWPKIDPAVTLTLKDILSDGRIYVAAKATDLGGGTWNYEYAVYNYNSHRSAGSFSVPVPGSATVTNIGFHDVDYHSGEPFDGTDWSASVAGDAVTWATTPFATNPNANALRWGTLYNFRFDADLPPGTADVTIGLFRPGTGSAVTLTSTVPAQCITNGVCEPWESCTCTEDCPGEGPDGDSDGYGDCVDCASADPNNWATPGEVPDLLLEHDAANGTTLSWSPPVDPGCVNPTYEILRSNRASTFVSPATVCLGDPDPTDTSAVELFTPPPNKILFYLVRAVNACPDGLGPLGDGNPPRQGITCP